MVKTDMDINRIECSECGERIESAKIMNCHIDGRLPVYICLDCMRKKGMLPIQKQKGGEE